MSENIEQLLNFINQLSELLAAESSDDFIRALPDQVCKFLQTDACIIWKKFSQGEKLAIVAYSSQVDTDYQKVELDLRHPTIQALIGSDNHISCVYDIDQYCAEHHLIEQEKIQERKWVSLLSCVVRKQNNVLGIVDIFTKNKHDFLEWEKFFMRHISNLITIAWQKNEQMLPQKVTHIIRQMINIQDEEKLWDLLYQGAAQLVDAEYWLIGKLEHGQTKKVRIIRHNNGFKYGKEFDWRFGIMGWALNDEKTIYARNVKDSPWQERYKAGWPDTRSEIALPIMVEGIPIREGTEIGSGTKVIGILNIESTKVDHFSQQDQEYLELLVGFAGILINRIEFDQKLKQLRGIEKRIAKTQDYDQTIQIVFDGIKHITKFSWINISLINSEKTMIEAKHVYGISDSEIKEFKKMARHSLDSDDIQVDIIKKKNIEATKDNDARFDQKILTKYNHKNLIRVFIPLIEPSTDQVMGTLEVGYPKEYRKYIYEEDVQILKSFADYLVDILELRKSGFAQRIIHELNSPIDGILSHASILQRRWNEISVQKITVKLDDIMVDAELLRYQARQFGYFFGKELSLNPKYVQTDVFEDVLLKIINQLIVIIRQEYKFQLENIYYNSSKMKNMGPVYTDKIMLNQVFFNLFMNALKYSKKSSMKKIELDYKKDIDKKQLIIMFKDWGIGIQTGHEKDIFKEGFRTLDAQKTAMGSGLGLTISKKIMNKLGGDLILHNTSEPTEFHVILPIGGKS